jgi:UTP-glucose-1-phosphate uridylyltransferase
MEEDFKKFILSKYADKIETTYVFQELDAIPAGFAVNPERAKPYGTAHAILVAKDAIHEPFTVINADDFYGKNSFKAMAEFLQQPQGDKPQFAMVGYLLPNTLSEHGSVSRGVCLTNEHSELTSMTEMTKISRTAEGIRNIDDNGTVTELTENTVVSMNFWGFTPYFFDCLNDMFKDFLQKNNDNPKSNSRSPLWSTISSQQAPPALKYWLPIRSGLASPIRKTDL